MRRFLLASRNSNKIREFHEILSSLKDSLGEFELFSFDDIGFTEEIEEDGTTFEENALIKARVGASMGYITIADDSGLAVDALGGAPGIYSARYSDVHGNDEANNDLLLRNLEQVTDCRSAQYVCAIACVFPDGDSFTVRGECKGSITRERHGNGGFGYDPLFYVDSLGKTFAEATPEEKNKISHRGVASKLFAEELKRRITCDTE